MIEHCPQALIPPRRSAGIFNDRTRSKMRRVATQLAHRLRVATRPEYRLGT
jgi:hypothetical protein